MTPADTHVRVGDLDLHVLTWTPAAPTARASMVLVHGLASNAHLWGGVAASLAHDGHHVVAVDLRGHGGSDKPDTGYDMPTVADDLVGLLDVLDLDRPVVAGQSWGGNVVVELAARHPGRCRAVACVDGGTIDLATTFPDWESCAAALRPPPITGTPAADMEALLRATHPDWPESGIAGAMACYEVRDDGTIAPWLTLDRHLAVLRGLWDHHPADRYGAVTDPMLFLLAGSPEGADPWQIAKAEATRLAEERLERVRVTWIDGDHDLHAQYPDRVADHLRALASTSDAPADQDS